jgi:predicted anti-sigma-YlaC factor YlaD
MKVLLTCREVIDFIERFLSGELSDAEARKFRWHLRLCRSCRAYLRTYRATLALEAAVREPPPPIPEELVLAVLRARR